MRMLNRWTRSLAGAGALLLLWGTPAFADGEVTFGSLWWDQTEPEAKYQEFGDLPRGAYLESFLYRDQVGKGRMTLWGSKALRDDQAIGFSYKAPRWRFDADYTQTPHNFSFVTRTGYTLLDPAHQVLPDSLQRANQENSGAYVATMNDFLKTADRINLGFRTDNLAARFKTRPARGFVFELKGVRKNRSGNKPYGGSLGFSNVIETIEPIRQTMADGSGTLSYSKDRVSVEGVVGYSAFQNDFDALEWDNPRRYTDAAGNPTKGVLDLYPDNQQMRLGGSIGVQFPRRTAFTGSVQWAQTTQDDKWLPYTSNTAVAQSSLDSLPGTNTDAKANTLLLDARLTSHPTSKVSGTLRYRQNKYDNKTPSWEFAGQVPYDGSWAAGINDAHPFGNEQTTLGADLDVRPIPEVSLYGTVESIKRERTFREVLKDDETAVQGKAVIRPVSGIQLTARVRHGSRELDEFEIEDYENAGGTLIEQSGLRRFDVADRKQDLADASISWTGMERLVLTGSVGYIENDYENSVLGLQDDIRRSASVDAVLNASARLDLTASIGWSKAYTSQMSRRSPGAAVVQTDSLSWQARLYDESISAIAGLDYVAVKDRLTLSSMFHFERSPGIYRLNGVGAYPIAAVDLPGTVYKRTGVDLEAMYQVQKNLQFGARWAWEEFEASDFATQDIPLLFPVTGTSNAIFLGDNVLNYRANAVAFVVKRTF
ncbi:MAG TPA: MtrB/PioB family outer membrane beta-barrel protein [Candidatus Eisenbacteria bacterium]|nr:MtrB/PioB family outer membrane beta-barrel protein [Candidatus Eisenbacteria bacterium]